MLKDQLLDNYELREIRLLDELYIHDGHIDKESLLDMLGVSNNVLTKIVDSINFRLRNHFGSDLVQYKKKTSMYALTEKGYLSLGQIVSIYAATSINFLIIREYLEKTVVQAEYLISELLISRADLYRRIKRINEVLQQFDIQVKDNQLKGKELQLRYFEQIFYQNIFPEQFLVYRSQEHNQFERLFKRLESYYRADLDSMQKARLTLWFTNLLKNRKKEREIGEIPSFIVSYLNNNYFYTEFTEIIVKFFKLFNIELKEIDKISTYLFNLTFFTMPFASEKTKEIVRYAMERDDIVGQSIKKMDSASGNRLIQSEEETTPTNIIFYLYYVFNCHHRALFFKGYLFHVDSTLLDYYQHYNYKEVVIRQWVASLCTSEDFEKTYLKDNQEFVFHKYMLYIYHEHSLIDSPMRVGVLLFTDPLMELMVIERMQLDLSREHDVRVERYQENHVYDLVVVNVPGLLESDNFEEEFVISSMGTPFDRQKISKKLFKLQAERLKNDISEDKTI
ncbi:helix-turn-helix domain-containing protein [Enterococcus mundtii]|uniref:Mga helix-turn-helix domain-containing protein n=1 Tax=Enterococcus mundtii TaxID=53346 RepID=A0A1V2UF06_ENTMU|nr:helix-turn-helix domain-containing protein [Enterococcus mundtii]ONN41812.1 hypothetical protein BTN92_11665 [Enterococcus mundtii]